MCFPDGRAVPCPAWRTSRRFGRDSAVLHTGFVATPVMERLVKGCYLTSVPFDDLIVRSTSAQSSLVIKVPSVVFTPLVPAG